MATRLHNEFTVPVPVGTAWEVLLDVERIAPCVPGALLDSVDGDEFTGRLKVRSGPVTITYRGRARITDKDASARTVVLDAGGKEARGPGTAAVTLRAGLREDGAGTTRVVVDTELDVTGRAAGFERGVIAEISARLVAAFAANLAAALERDTAAAERAAASDVPLVPVAAPRSAARPGGGAAVAAHEPDRPSPSPPVVAVGDHRDTVLDPLFLPDALGGPVVRRAVPALMAAVLAVLVLRWVLGRRGRR